MLGSGVKRILGARARAAAQVALGLGRWLAGLTSLGCLGFSGSGFRSLKFRVEVFRVRRVGFWGFRV